jgi:hypothetical protein
MKKIIVFLTAIVAISISAVLIGNYFFVAKPLNEVIAADPRNQGIEVRTRYGDYYKPSVLVFDLKNVSATNSSADVFRIFLRYAEVMKEKDFDRVLLSFRGDPKFQLTGDYFKKLGVEFEVQNPVYTMRTFTENVYKIDGSKAFGTWTGGLLGVLNKQMEDFNAFHQQWYRDDVVAELKGK